MPRLGLGASLTGGASSEEINYYLDFDGTNDYVDFGDSTDFTFAAGGDGFTVSIWVNMDAISTGYDAVVTKWNNSGEREWVFRFDNNRKMEVRLIDEDSNAWIGRYTNASTFSTDTWYHMLMTYDGGTADSNVTIYVDATKADDSNLGGGGTFTTMRNRTGALQVGSLLDVSQKHFPDGSMTSFHIFDVALDSDEITELYNIGKTDAISGHSQFGNCIGSWALNQDSGTTITDLTDGGNDGTVTNGATWTEY